MKIFKSIVNIYTLLVVFLVVCLLSDHARVDAAPLPQGKAPTGAQAKTFSHHLASAGKAVVNAGKTVVNYVKTGAARVGNYLGNLRKPKGAASGSTPGGFPKPTKPAGAAGGHTGAIVPA